MTPTTLVAVATLEAVHVEPEDASSVRGRLARVAGHRVSLLLAPAVLYLLVRELGLLALRLMADRWDKDVTGALTSWDGQWFLGIAGGGYGDVPSGLVDAFGRRSAETPLAFFPGYPVLVRWLDALPGVGTVGAAFAVSLVSGLVCAYGLARLGASVFGGSRRAGLVLVVLFAASPMSVVLSMAYSEATFCALAAWSLVGVVERRWLLAGLCCAGAGLVRPTAGALVLAVCAAAAAAIWQRRDGWRPWAGGLLAPLGLAGYLGYVAVVTGRWDGWFAVQRDGWDSRFDGGAATWKFALLVLGDPRSVLELATVWFLVAALVLVALGLRRGPEWPLVVYGAGVLAMDLGSNGLMNSKARLLLPAFTLLVPVALALARRRTPTVVAVLVGVSVFSAWFGAYAITAWRYAI
ncbi:glycosyltransferase family 39 protein [Saccharothrix xinjiangensis]